MSNNQKYDTGGVFLNIKPVKIISMFFLFSILTNIFTQIQLNK